MKCYLTCILVLFIFNINIIYSKSIENLSNTHINNNNDNDKSNGDKYYLIYVNNTHGEYKVFSKSKFQKRQESQIFVESLVDEINSLIINNKDTYQNPKKLEEIEKISQLKKRKRNFETQEYYTYDESNFVYPISSVNDRVVLYAYLSNILTQKLSSLNENIIDIVPNSYSSTLNHKNYNVNDILSETGWKNLSVRENADFHLSLISQGVYNQSLVNEYDNNYYYPSSAGKNIDIVILDSSFHFNYSEFSNTNDRIVKCAGNVVDGKASVENIDQYCGYSELHHGEIVSDAAAGLLHGVANRANVYGVSLPANELGGVLDSDTLGGLQFIYENMIRPHKTVINISIGGPHFEDAYYKQSKELINKITEKGGIVVAAGGNYGYDLEGFPYHFIPCEFDDVICVGGFENKQENKKGNFEKIYKVASGSNYGRGVNLFAPFYVDVEILKENNVKKVSQMGTSFSSPIVAGAVATLMSENSEIEYTKETIYEKLYENGKSEFSSYYKKIGFLANNGKHIVYSEDGQYNGCGIYAGNILCNGN